MLTETNASVLSSDQLQNLCLLCDAVSRTDTLEEIYDAALDGLLRSLRANRASVLLFDADGFMRFAAWRNLSDDYRRAVEGHTPWTPDALDPQPIVINDVTADASLGPLRDTILGEGIRAMGFVPLVYRGRLLGKFMIYYDAPHPFTDEEVLVARLIAGHIAFAIERKRAVEQLTLYREVIAHSNDAIAMISPEGHYIEQNPAHRSLLGYEDLVSARRTPTVHIGEEAFAEIIRTLAEHGQYRGEIRSRTRDGLELDIEMSAFTVRDEAGEAVCHVSIKRDVTARKRIEEGLRKTTQTVRAIIEACPLAVLALDAEGRVRLWNPAAERTFGWKAEEVLDRPIPTVPDELREVFETNTRDALTGRVFTRYETRRRRKDGALIDVSISTSPLLDDEGSVYGLVAVVEDITGRKLSENLREQLLEREREARRAAEEANHLKDQFLATVSHELRTPLTAIAGWTHLLRSGQINADETERALAIIERNARAQAELINDLLDVSRIVTGKLQLDARPLDPVACIDAATEALRPTAESKGVQLVKDGATSVGIVSGDSARLQQVVWNLVANAIKFTPKGGRVEVRTERASDRLRIVVSDSGQGISPDFLPHVFDHFRQADGSTTRQHGGLGLGLAIVRHLVELHGGTVEAASEGEGRGATFTVSLPVINMHRNGDAARSREDAEAANGCAARLDGLRILVVEDEDDTRELLLSALRHCGADAAGAPSVSAAMQFFNATPPDAVVCDIGMPAEDGFDFIERVRDLPAEEGGRVPAIALTAYVRGEDRLRALRSGFQMHLPKPVEIPELVAIIAGLARRG